MGHRRDGTLSPGDLVRTSLGKGTLREVRRGRVVVEINGRQVVLAGSDVTPLEMKRPRKRTAAAEASTEQTAGQSMAIDLHGLTVEDALSAAALALNDALLADAPELRVIHGRSGGRIRAALHRWLREMPTVRAFRVDPRNPGVTIVSL